MYAEALVAVQRVGEYRIDESNAVLGDSFGIFRLREVAVGDSPVIDHLAIRNAGGKGQLGLVIKRFAGFKALVVCCGSDVVGIIVNLILCCRLELCRSGNIALGGQLAARVVLAVGFWIARAVFEPLFYRRALVRYNGEQDLLALVDVNTVFGYVLGFYFIAVNVVQGVLHLAAVCRRNVGSCRILVVCLEYRLDSQCAVELINGVNTGGAVGLVMDVLAIGIDPLYKAPAAVCVCLDLNLAVAGDFFSILRCAAIDQNGNRTVFSIINGCVYRISRTGGFELDRGVFGEGERILALIRVGEINFRAVHLILCILCHSVTRLGCNGDPGVAGEGSLVRYDVRNSLVFAVLGGVACVQVAVKCQRVVVTHEVGGDSNVGNADTNGQRIFGRINAFLIIVLANPLIEVPARIRFCGERKFRILAGRYRERGNLFTGDRTGAFIVDLGIQNGLCNLEINLYGFSVGLGLDGNVVGGNRQIVVINDDFLRTGSIGPAAYPLCYRIAGIRVNSELYRGIGRVGVGRTAVCTCFRARTDGHNGRRCNRVCIRCIRCIAEILRLECQAIGQAVYSVNAGYERKFVVCVQRVERFIGSCGLARRNGVVTRCNLVLDKVDFFDRRACGVDDGVVELQVIELDLAVCTGEVQLFGLGQIDSIRGNTRGRSFRADSDRTRNDRELGFSGNILGNVTAAEVGCFFVSVQRVSADVRFISLEVVDVRLNGSAVLVFLIQLAGEEILVLSVADSFSCVRVIDLSGQFSANGIAIGEAAYISIAFIGQRQLIAGACTNDHHLLYGVVDALEYLIAGVVNAYGVCAVLRYNKVLERCNAILELCGLRTGEVLAADGEQDGAGCLRVALTFGNLRLNVQCLVFLIGAGSARLSGQGAVRCALAVCGGDLRRIRGDGVFRSIVIQQVYAAAISALIGCTGIGNGERRRCAAVHIIPAALAVQLLPHIGYTFVLSLFGIGELDFGSGVAVRVDIHRGIAVSGSTRIDGQLNIRIALIRLGVALERFAVNAGFLALALVLVAGLDLIFVFGIGRQAIFILKGELVGAVLIALARGERNICDLSAARALREVVVAVNLKTGNNLVIRPCELYRIGGRIGYILLEIIRQGRGSCDFTQRIRNDRERHGALTVIVGEDLPVHGVAVVLGLDRHILKIAGDGAALGGDLYLTGRALRTGYNAYGKTACASTGLGFDGVAGGVGFCGFLGERDRLGNGVAAVLVGIADRLGNAARKICAAVFAGFIDGRISGRVADGVCQHAAGNARQDTVILSDGFVIGQAEQLDRRLVRDGNGGGDLLVAALFVRVCNIGIVDVNLHRDGVECYLILAGGRVIGDTLLDAGGILGFIGEACGVLGFRLSLTDLHAEYGKFLLKGYIRTDRDRAGRNLRAAGARGALVGGGGLGIVARKVISAEQVREIRRRSQHSQHLRVGVGEVVVAGVLHVAGVIIRVGKAQRVGAVDRCALVFRAACAVQVEHYARGLTGETLGVLLVVGEGTINFFGSFLYPAVGSFPDELMEPVLVVRFLNIVRHSDFAGSRILFRSVFGTVRYNLCQGEQRTGAVVAGNRTGSGTVLNVVLAGFAGHTVHIVAGLLDDQTGFFIYADDKAVEVQQVGGALLIAHRARDDGRVGRAQRQRVEYRISCGTTVSPHLGVHERHFAGVLVLRCFEQVKVLGEVVGRKFLAVPVIQRNIARIRLVGLEVGIRLGAQDQRVAAAGQVAERERCTHEVAAAGNQRKFLTVGKHIRAGRTEHNDCARALVQIRAVVIAPCAGEVVNAVAVHIAADNGDHVGNNIILFEVIRPCKTPVGRAGEIAGFVGVKLNAGVANLRNIDCNFIVAVAVPVAGGNL